MGADGPGLARAWLRLTPARSGVRIVRGTVLKLPIDEDEPRNALPNAERREDGYEHPSSKLEDVFAAMRMTLTEARTGRRRSMDILSAERSVSEPSVPCPATGGLAGGGPARLQ